MEFLTYLLIGSCVGCMGSMLGIGGGVVIVPLLTFVFDFPPPMAIGTSMLVVLLNALSGTVGYLKQKKICWDAAWKFSLATMPGAFLGSYCSEYLKGRLFFLVFGIFFFLFAIHMFRKAGSKAAEQGSEEVPENYNWQLGVVSSIGVGFIASILGIGGGVVHVPMMTYALHFPVKVAIATSTAILAVSAIAGAVSHAALGHLVWITGLGLGLGASIGAQLGVRLAVKTKSSLLMKFTSALVMATAIKFLLTAAGI